jgi:HEPN domain-containing protein/predicted nucleotidyltransferase
MKKLTLPKKSEPYEEHIRKVCDIIVNTAPDKIAFVILFGSFARGTWVRDRYSEGNAVFEYASDFDFLIITNAKKKDNGKENANGISAFDLERKIKNEIEQNSIRYAHKEHLVIEPLDYVNSELEKGRYFFSDIKKEGILLYSSNQFSLAEPRILSDDEVHEIAKADYDHWFKSAEVFLKQCENAFKISEFKNAAFQLHQATEHFYNCILLVLTGYKPKTHDLVELNKLCATRSNDFLTIFPLATEEQKESFKLLNKAYIDARYNKNYVITKDQLEYLMKRIERLKELVEKTCARKI